MFHNSAGSKQIWVLTGLLTFLISLEPTLSTNNSLSPDSVRLYHDIVSGHGLYNGFTKLTELGGSNFHHVVFGNETKKMWLVEFYNSWCGHCHKFAPTWKALASDVYGWRNNVKIGVVECSNRELCRDMEVTQFPTIRLFPPHSLNTSLGEDFVKEATADEMRVNLVKRLKKYHIGQNFLEGSVNLKPVTNVHDLDKLLSTDLSSEIVYVILVFEPEDSTAGAELTLDLSRMKEVRVWSVLPRNTSLFHRFGINEELNNVVIIDRNQRVINLHVDHLNRYSLNKAVREFLVNRGINVSVDMPLTYVTRIIEVNSSNINQILDGIKRKLNIKDLSQIVFKNDLQSAVRYALMNEVALHKVITGVQLSTLKNFLHVLIKYFPANQKEEQFLKKLLGKSIGQKSQIGGEDFYQACVQLQKKYNIFWFDQSWIGCMGSSPIFRGYPCSLWSLFHTLVIQEQIQDLDNPSGSLAVLPAMIAYIKHFFTCSECAAHFAEMAETIAGNVTTQKESILWLWAAHNTVNMRLAGDESEDPSHKKIQFPSEDVCPLCRENNQTWNKPEVLHFLIKMYTNIFDVVIDGFPKTTRKPTNDFLTTTQKSTLKPTESRIGFVLYNSSRHIKYEYNSSSVVVLKPLEYFLDLFLKRNNF